MGDTEVSALFPAWARSSGGRRAEGVLLPVAGHSRTAGGRALAKNPQSVYFTFSLAPWFLKGLVKIQVSLVMLKRPFSMYKETFLHSKS